MKQNRTILAIAIAALTFSPLAFAQTTVVTGGTTVTGGTAIVGETATTTTAGTISEFSPDTIIVRSETAPAPVRYSYTKTTTYVDDTGAPVELATVKSGLPVTVHYVREGDRMIANRVIVHRRKTVTTEPVVREERRVVTPAPVVEERRVVTPAPVIEERKTTTTTTTTKKDKDKD